MGAPSLGGRRENGDMGGGGLAGGTGPQSNGRPFLGGMGDIPFGGGGRRDPRVMGVPSMGGRRDPG